MFLILLRSLRLNSHKIHFQRNSNTEYEPYIISINVHCYLYYECTFLHCVLSSNHEQKCVHCKENNGNGLKPKS